MRSSYFTSVLTGNVFFFILFMTVTQFNVGVSAGCLTSLSKSSCTQSVVPLVWLVSSHDLCQEIMIMWWKMASRNVIEKEMLSVLMLKETDTNRASFLLVLTPAIRLTHTQTHTLSATHFYCEKKEVCCNLEPRCSLSSSELSNVAQTIYATVQKVFTSPIQIVEFRCSHYSHGHRCIKASM